MFGMAVSSSAAGPSTLPLVGFIPSVTGAEMPRPQPAALLFDPPKHPTVDIFVEVMQWPNGSVPPSPFPSSESESNALPGFIPHPFGLGTTFESPTRPSPNGEIQTPHFILPLHVSPDIIQDYSSSPPPGIMPPDPLPETSLHLRYSTEVFDVLQTYRGPPHLDRLFSDSAGKTTIKMSLRAEDNLDGDGVSASVAAAAFLPLPIPAGVVDAQMYLLYDRTMDRPSNKRSRRRRTTQLLPHLSNIHLCRPSLPPSHLSFPPGAKRRARHLRMGVDGSVPAGLVEDTFEDSPVGVGGLMAKFARETDEVRAASLVLAFVLSSLLPSSFTASAATVVERAVFTIATVKAFNAATHEICVLAHVLRRVSAAADGLAGIWGLTSSMKISLKDDVDSEDPSNAKYGTFTSRSGPTTRCVTPIPGEQKKTTPREVAVDPSWRELRISHLTPHLWLSWYPKLQFIAFVCFLLVLGRIVNALLPLTLDQAHGPTSYHTSSVYLQSHSHPPRTLDPTHAKRKTGELLRILDCGSAANPSAS
ncbi:hypothetical protein DFH29DRAFT_1022906 [Suillus ampliporus]|nr:hypothetical protein DFH29DRAFT_1022906 [Suillus ampliporus]